MSLDLSIQLEAQGSAQLLRACRNVAQELKGVADGLDVEYSRIKSIPLLVKNLAQVNAKVRAQMGVTNAVLTRCLGTGYPAELQQFYIDALAIATQVKSHRALFVPDYINEEEVYINLGDNVKTAIRALITTALDHMPDIRDA